MALKLPDKSYLVIDKFGNYVIYKNTTARRKYKKAAINVNGIILAYDTALRELYNDESRQYYDKESWIKEVEALEQERIDYIQAAINGNHGLNFPIMEKLCPEVKESIPKIITTGRIPLFCESVEDAYSYVKQNKIFGETEDC